MGIERSKNPSLREYKLVQRSFNFVEYVIKGTEEDDKVDYLDSKILDSLDTLRPFYQFKSEEPVDQDQREAPH